VGIVYMTGQRMPWSGQMWIAFGMMGIFNNVLPFSLIIWGETQIQSGLAAILNATSPLFSVVLAHLWTRQERLTPNRVSGVLIGLVGVGVLMGPKVLAGLNLTSLAQLAVIVASISYAWSAIYARRFRALGVPPLTVAAGQTVTAAVLATPLALVIDRPWSFSHAPSLPAWGALAGLIVLSTVLAYIVYFRILASAGATNALLVTFLSPVSALVLGALILKERVLLVDVIGMLLIFMGLAVMDGRLFRMFRPRVAAADISKE